MVITLLTYSYLIITVGLLAFFLRKSQEGMSAKKNIIWWGLFGIIFNFYSFSWLYTVYPLIWIKDGVPQLLGIFLLHVVLTLLCSIPFGVVGYFFREKITPQLRPAIFAISLVAAEIMRSLLLSILFYGDKTTVNLHFTTGTIGNALSITPFIEYAYIGGTFALTFILGYLVYVFSSKKDLLLYWSHGIGIVTLLIGIHFFVPVYGPAQPLQVGVVTTNFETTTDDKILAQFKEYNDQIQKMTVTFSSSTDIIVYPEDTRYLSYLSEEDRGLLARSYPHTLFLDGDTIKKDDKLVNVSIFFSGEEEKVKARGKNFLFPFNEYMPYLFEYVFRYFVGKDQMEEYIKNHTYTPIYSENIVSFKNTRIATLLCSEIISYKVLQDIKKQSPDIVFFQSHLNVFHNNPWFVMHMYSFTKVAAAQLRRPLISSISGAPSPIISPYGAIIKIVPPSFSTSTYVFKR